MSYELENLNDGRCPFIVSGGIDLDVPAGDLAIPRFTRIQIGQSAWSDELRAGAEAVYAGADPGARPALPDGLTLELNDAKRLEFSQQVTLPRGVTTRVSYEVRRAIRVPGIYVLSCPTPADGIEIDINTRGTDDLEFEVRPLHSQADQIARLGTTGTWQFPYGILPWQGFQILSRRPGDVAIPAVADR